MNYQAARNAAAAARNGVFLPGRRKVGKTKHTGLCSGGGAYTSSQPALLPQPFCTHPLAYPPALFAV